MSEVVNHANAAGHHLVPLTPVGQAPISAARDKELEAVAAALREGDEALDQPAPEVRDMLAQQMPQQGAQRLLFDDFSVISHIDGVLGLEYYTSRAFVRAGQGDLILGTFDPIPGYAEYMDERLGLGLASYLPIPKIESARPYAVCRAALAQDDVLDQLAARCGDGEGALWMHPYMGHVDAWGLAQQLQARIDRPIKVVAPPPVLCDRVNHKGWFLSAVRQTLGDAFALELTEVTTAEDAAAGLLAFAKDHARVTIKLADSASGMGTTVYESADLLALPEGALTRQIQAWMAEKNWDPASQPALSVGPWHDDFLGSPSVQLWIPPTDVGMPWVEGIYDQLFYPDDPFVFLGSIPSQLPQALQAQLAETGAAIGRVFQRLGYIGRCSFDTILTGPDLDRAQLIYVECNGRWGGTSTPMTLLNRVFGDYREHPYVANDFADHRLIGMPFDEFVAMFDDVLYDARTGKGWAMVYNVGCLAPAGKLDIIALGKDIDEARARQQQFQALVQERAGDRG